MKTSKKITNTENTKITDHAGNMVDMQRMMATVPNDKVCVTCHAEIRSLTLQY